MQEIDTQLMRLNRERAALDNGDHARAARDTLAAALQEQEQQLNLLNSARISKEDDLATREAKINTQQTRLMKAQSTHEIQALERDIKALSAARSELDETVLLLMDDIEQCAAKLDELRGQHQEQEQLLEQIENAFAAESARLDAESDVSRGRRETKFAELSAVEQKKYEDTAARHHGIAVVHIENGSCSVCGTALTPFNLKEAKTQQWPTCESCRRLLYVE